MWKQSKKAGHFSYNSQVGRPKTLSVWEEQLLVMRVERLLERMPTISNKNIIHEAMEIVLESSGVYFYKTIYIEFSVLSQYK